MSIKANSTYLFSSQEQDSIRNTLRPVVTVPQKIELKVERPKIKSLNTESDSILTPRNTTPLRPVRKAIVQEVKPEPVIDPYFPDTLDYVLVTDWETSAFTKVLWSSQSNDSVCFLSVDYNKNDITGQKQTESEKAEVPAKEVGDSTIIAKKAVNKVEEIKMKDPSLVTPKNYEQPLLSQDWFVIVLIFQVALTGFIRFRWQKYLSDIFNAIVFPNIANKIQNSTNGTQKTASFWLVFLFYSNFSLLLFETMRISQRTFFNLNGWLLPLTLFGLLIAIFSLKFVVYHFVGWIFRIKEPISEYLFQSSIMSKAFGVMILPLIVLFPFLEPEARNWVPRIGLTVFILLYLIQIGKGIVANLRNTLSVYYIILYLCALEILPLSILYKLLFY